MKLVGEVYQIDCNHCKSPFQVVIKPGSTGPMETPRFIPYEAAQILDSGPDRIRTSTVRCPKCNDFHVSFIGELLFIVGDVDEFDEIEQHR